MEKGSGTQGEGGLEAEDVEAGGSAGPEAEQQARLSWWSSPLKACFLAAILAGWDWGREDRWLDG